MSNSDYHESEGVSKSALDDIAWERGKSPLHYWDKRINPKREPFQQTAAMALGTAIHSAVLEPDDFASSYVEIPEDAPAMPPERSIKAKNPSDKTLDALAYWEDFQAKHAGKIALSTEEYAAAIGARDSVLLHPNIGGLFQGGRAEQSFFAIDPETGELIKCRPDYEKLEQGLIIDLKSTADASEEGFGGSATKFRYDVQDPWYRDVVSLAMDDQTLVRAFAFVAVQTTRPYACGLYYMTPDDIRRGREMARRDLNLIAACRAAGHWPDFADQPRILRIRGAARRHLS